MGSKVKRYKLKITKENSEGYYLDIFDCPIARSLRDRGFRSNIMIGGTSVHIGPDQYRIQDVEKFEDRIENNEYDYDVVLTLIES